MLEDFPEEGKTACWMRQKIFEINARHSGTTYFRMLFGYNEIDLILNYYFPLSNLKRANLREGTAIRYYEEAFINND